MARRADQRSPLALLVLALLAEAPMHPYLMQQLIRQRGKDTVVNVARSASVYQTIDRLERAGLITHHEHQRAPGKPERAAYRLTEDGQTALYGWLDSMLAEPGREYPEFPAALSVAMLRTPTDLLPLLETRAAALTAELDRLAAQPDYGLPRISMIEDEYRAAMVRAELAWTESIAAELRSGTLSWTMPEIIAAAEQSRKAASSE
ncbi:PadR family transcriptional regulator [Nocardia arthritidis]|uniref:PadR family transcriptional regulator n=1 Tax=Nocardia arthritidis TaxID=228602 RepID=A0A6G9YL76_9NOCA|nr:helix-turn-helix transcriptional regulator [Nocardia arthritidis]QIS13827.1 PadR family transcriptional regulator [Nocardia arthritidis]